MTAMIYPTPNPSATETMIVARGEGPYIYDHNGKQYLEGMAGLWCTSLGYGNQEIIAGMGQIKEFLHARAQPNAEPFAATQRNQCLNQLKT